MALTWNSFSAGAKQIPSELLSMWGSPNMSRGGSWGNIGFNPTDTGYNVYDKTNGSSTTYQYDRQGMLTSPPPPAPTTNYTPGQGFDQTLSDIMANTTGYTAPSPFRAGSTLQVAGTGVGTLPQLMKAEDGLAFAQNASRNAHALVNQRHGTNTPFVMNQNLQMAGPSRPKPNPFKAGEQVYFSAPGQGIQKISSEDAATRTRLAQIAAANNNNRQPLAGTTPPTTAQPSSQQINSLLSQLSSSGGLNQLFQLLSAFGLRG